MLPVLLVLLFSCVASENLVFSQVCRHSEHAAQTPVQRIDICFSHPLWFLDPARDAPMVYRLYAVSNHMGSTHFGHYTAYCKHPYLAEWHEFDDTRYSLSLPLHSHLHLPLFTPFVLISTPDIGHSQFAILSIQYLQTGQ